MDSSDPSRRRRRDLVQAFLSSDPLSLGFGLHRAWLDLI